MIPLGTNRMAGADAREHPLGWGRFTAGPYASLMVAAAILGMAKGLVFAWVLGPTAFGTYAIIVLVAGFGDYLCSFGIAEGLLRRLSVIAPTRPHRASYLRNEAAAASLILCIGATAIAAGGALASRQAQVLSVVGLIGLYTASAIGLKIILTDLRARRRTMAFALGLATKNALALAGGAVAGAAFGLAAAVLAEVAAVIGITVAGILITGAGPVQRPGAQTLRVARSLQTVGAPFMAGNALRTGGSQVDRWIVAATLPTATMGVYSLGMWLQNVGLSVTNMVSQYIGPGLIHEWAANRDPDRLLRSLDRFAILIIGTVAAGGMAISTVAWYGIPRLLPGYIDVVPLLPLVVVGVSLQSANIYDLGALATGRGSAVMSAHSAGGLIALAVSLVAAHVGSLQLFVLGFGMGRLASLLMLRRAVRAAAIV